MYWNLTTCENFCKFYNISEESDIINLEIDTRTAVQVSNVAHGSFVNIIIPSRGFSYTNLIIQDAWSQPG